MKRTALVVSLLLAFAVSVCADEAPPRKSADPIDSRLYIQIDPGAKEATLVITPSTLEELYNGRGEAAGLASLTSRTQTLFGGLLLSASFVLGGVWLARRKMKSAGAVSAVLLAAVAGTVLVTANVGPPLPEGIDNSVFSDRMKQMRNVRGAIKIRVADDEFPDGVKLIVPLAKKENQNGS